MSIGTSQTNLLEEIMSMLPGDARDSLQSILKELISSSSLSIIKAFIDDFDPNCPIEQLIASILGRAIGAIGSGIIEDMSSTSYAGKETYTGKEATRVVIAKLRMMADELEMKISQVESMCCEKKH